MSTIALPQSDLAVLLDSPGEGRSTLEQLGIVPSDARAAGRASLGERLASDSSIPRAAVGALTEILTIIDTAERRLELSTGLPDVTALLAYVAGGLSGLVLVTRAGLLVRTTPTLQLPDAVQEIVEDSQREGTEWTLAAWQGSSLTTALRSRGGALDACAASAEAHNRLEGASPDIASLVTGISLGTI